LALLTGAMFAAVEDRGEARAGFLQHDADVVVISGA